jgi:hypothetical protein
MCVNGWFFDIYIQGSKKSTTLRAESEIKRRREAAREFQLSKNLCPGPLHGTDGTD